jgi:hypothetical protein
MLEARLCVLKETKKELESGQNMNKTFFCLCTIIKLLIPGNKMKRHAKLENAV